jgi:hypothetical protein
MAKTLDEAFSIYLSRLTPSKTESANAKSHRASIDACIKANFGLSRFFRTGSFGNGTSISGYSDVDYIASIPRGALKADSNVTLDQLKNVLDKRFPSTGVHINAPAVVVPFGTDVSESTEIVPADYIERNSDCSVYDIPDRNGGWMRSSPELHKAYIDYVDDKLNNKVKPLIRFVKAWKFNKNVKIRSFYLEMYIGKFASGEKTIAYSIDIKTIFEQLSSNNFPSIADPMGVAGNIHPFQYVSDRTKATTEISEALGRAIHARNAEKENRIEDAFYWWDRVYGGSFPGYY